MWCIHKQNIGAYTVDTPLLSEPSQHSQNGTGCHKYQGLRGDWHDGRQGRRRRRDADRQGCVNVSGEADVFAYKRMMYGPSPVAFIPLSNNAAGLCLAHLIETGLATLALSSLGPQRNLWLTPTSQWAGGHHIPPEKTTLFKGSFFFLSYPHLNHFSGHQPPPLHPPPPQNKHHTKSEEKKHQARLHDWQFDFVKLSPTFSNSICKVSLMSVLWHINGPQKKCVLFHTVN